MLGKFETSLGYTARPSLKKITKNDKREDRRRGGEEKREERQPNKERTIKFLVLIQFFTETKENSQSQALSIFICLFVFNEISRVKEQVS